MWLILPHYGGSDSKACHWTQFFARYVHSDLFACLILINDLYCDVHFTVDEC